MGALRSFRVWRGDRDGGQLEDFKVEVNEGEVVLDIIHRLQATQTPDLAVRWNCKAGKCGSCSMEINGTPRLGCMTRMSTFPEDETVTITPLRTFPVIRDLVTDVSYNYTKARELPAFAPPKGLAPGEYRMQQVDVDRSQEFRKCIECFLCQNTCHVIRDHDENKEPFSGPRLFIRAAELDMHPLDTRTDRKQLAHAEQGLGYCNITKCCTEVCPEHIKITDNAIIPMKERVVDNRYDPLVWLGRKIFRRDQIEHDVTPRHTPHEPTHADARVVPRGVQWHAPQPGAQLPELGPDGKLPLTEITFDRAGAASPFGDNVTFPLPSDHLTYQHPAHDHQGNEHPGEGKAEH
jgi:succinate dehydrogenase / fumarate reductase iron-sulfur subunit